MCRAIIHVTLIASLLRFELAFGWKSLFEIVVRLVTYPC